MERRPLMSGKQDGDRRGRNADEQSVPVGAEPPRRRPVLIGVDGAG